MAIFSDLFPATAGLSFAHSHPHLPPKMLRMEQFRWLWDKLGYVGSVPSPSSAMSGSVLRAFEKSP